MTAHLNMILVREAAIDLPFDATIRLYCPAVILLREGVGLGKQAATKQW
jgi:hypothetical protein